MIKFFDYYKRTVSLLWLPLHSYAQIHVVWTLAPGLHLILGENMHGCNIIFLHALVLKPFYINMTGTVFYIKTCFG